MQNEVGMDNRMENNVAPESIEIEDILRNEIVEVQT